MSVQAIFEAMGIPTEKALAAHLLLENAHESNLVPDIAQVDYLEGHLRHTNLQPLEGLPVFADDIYAFGDLSREACVAKGGSLFCTVGDNGTAKQVVADTSTAAHKTLGTAPDGTTRRHIHTAIAYTVGTNNAAAEGTIRATVARIERDTGCRAPRKWQEIYPNTQPAAIFVAKLDVFEMPMDELLAELPSLEHHLLAVSYGIYCIDYIQDFSGVLDREALVAHLLSNYDFCEQGDLAEAIGGNAPIILANTGSVGDHVCTWVRSCRDGYTARTKIYNKTVSNFEAG